MNLRQLELFISLAKNPNISQVAKENFLTQSAVSVALKGLEQDLGVQLFDRLNRRLALNPHGRTFMRNLEPALQNLNEVLRIFEGDNMNGELVVGASSTIADYILPQIMFEFEDRYPNVTIKTVFTNPHDIAEGLEQGDIDIGLVETEIESPDLEFIRLCKDELFVVSSDDDFAKEGPYSIEELLNKKWVLREPGAGSRDTFTHYMGDYMKDLRIVMEMHHTVSIKRVLQNPDTLSCLSPFAIQRELEHGELFRVPLRNMQLIRHFYAVMHRDKYRTRLMETFYHAVESYLGTDRQIFSEE
ncbi:MAG: LysR substrate-binding domain-containing protein [Halodesulfovibrio sp.]